MSQDHVARTDWKTFRQLAPDAYDSVVALNKIAEQNGLDKQLLELVKLRASQINGCAFCVQYHIMAAEKLGIDADRLNLVVVWREAPIFSARERAALAWTEALTLVSHGVSDELYAEVSAEFSEKELVICRPRSPRSTSGTVLARPIAGPRRRGRSRRRRKRREPVTV
jgi:AhpD family alkylhydroperoxidase